MSFTFKQPAIGNYALDNAQFLRVYEHYEARLSENAKDLCTRTVLIDDDGDWIVQSGFDLMANPTGFGVTIEEAAEDFMRQILKR